MDLLPHGLLCLLTRIFAFCAILETKWPEMKVSKSHIFRVDRHISNFFHFKDSGQNFLQIVTIDIPYSIAIFPPKIQKS